MKYGKDTHQKRKLQNTRIQISDLYSVSSVSQNSCTYFCGTRICALVDSLEELLKQTIHLSGNKVNVEVQIVGTNGFVFGFQSIDEKQNLTKLNFCLEWTIKKKKKMKQRTWKERIFLTDQRHTKISYKYFYTCIELKKNIIDIINCDKFNYVKNVGIQV